LNNLIKYSLFIHHKSKRFKTQADMHIDRQTDKHKQQKHKKQAIA